MKPLRLLALCVATVSLTACGGGGGDSPPPTPTVSLTANPATVVAGGTTALTWSSSNASSCAASGGWSGAKATSGTETTTALTANTTFTITCGSAVANANVTVTQPATVAVSGQLLVPSNTQTDSDTNDIVLKPVPNNTPATAQSLPNPVMVGGYVNQPGQGSSGPLQATGDVEDFYSVALLANQAVELTVANPNPATDDVDLELYDSGGAFLKASTEVGRYERLTVSTAGNYFVRVHAYAGASNYILNIGLTSSAVSDLSTDREFIPGELLVKMRDSVTGVAKPQASLDALGLKVLKTTPGLHSLVQVSTSAASLEKIRPGLSAKADAGRYKDDLQRQKLMTLYAVKELRKRSDVAWAEPNWILRAYVEPNDSLYGRQSWHYEAMQLPSAWDVTKGNSNVVVAVVDSGVRSHAEFNGRLVNPFDFVDDDTDASDPGVSAQGNYYFHGTHVAGTIGARGNNSSGVTGVAWDVSLMPVRVLGSNGSGSFDDILNGVLYAARLANSSGRLPTKGADVINLSLGALGSCPQGAQDVFDRARAAGSIIVAAAGNENTTQPSTPAVCNGVVSVAAVDTRRQRAPYSNSGDTIDVAAPGGDTSQDRNGDGYPDGIYSTHATRSAAGTYADANTYMQGTSMAAPHVAGVFALMRAVNPNITPAQIDTLLSNGDLTDDIGAPGRDALGVGAINAFKAVRAAGGGLAPPALRIDANPTSLNFGAATTSGEVVIANGGANPISITGVTSSVPWLTATAVSVDANGLGRYRIDANRAALAAGVYRESVQFRAGAISATVTVVLQVGGSSGESNAGQHYLLLIDPVTGEAEYQVEVLARGTAVNFNFAAVLPGQYQLSVGTDLNNDGLICDDGEACGQYPVYGEPRTIDVSSGVTGLVVTTNYRTDVAPAAAQAGSKTDSAKRRLR